MTQEDKLKLVQQHKNNPVMLMVFMLQESANVIRSNKGLYFYNGKCYDLLTNESLDTLYLDFTIKYEISNSFKIASLVIRALKAYSKIKDVPKLNDYEGMLCLNNGVLNIYTREFFPHSKDYYFDSCINIDYDDKNGDCPSFMSYLNHTFNGDQDTITNIVRLGGYLLDTSCAAQKMFMFDGNGGSGKSTLVDTFSMFFIESMDEKNQVTSLSLTELSKPGFDNEILVTSRFNPCAETKKGYIDAEEIKKIISGDIVKVSRKYEKAVNFRPKTKIVVASNGLGKFTDTSDGIFRRLCIIPFDNQYKPLAEVEKIANADIRRIFPRDEDLMTKIKSEKTAILNLFIDGLIELKKNKYTFIDSEVSARAISDFKRDSDTVREFLEDNYELDMACKIPLKEVFEQFRFWYRDNVQDSGSMRFRSAEMGKRIREVFGIKSVGQIKYYNKENNKYEFLSVYPLKEKVIEGDIEAEYTEQEAKQQNIEF